MRTGLSSQDVWNLVFRGILEEVPHLWWSHLIQLLQLLLVLGGLFEVLFRTLLPQFLLISNSFGLVVIDERLNLTFFQRLEGLEKDIVLDILKNLIINMFQRLHCFEPLRLVLFVEIAFPYPVSPKSLSLCFLQTLLFLFVTQIKQIDICFI